MTDGVSNEPVVASIPAPISVESRVAPGEAAEVARQADEAKVAKDTPGAKTEKAEPVAKPSIRDSIAKAQAKVNAEPTPAKALSVAAAEPAVAAKEAPAAKAAEAAPAKAADAKETPAAVARAEDGKFVSTKPAAEVAPAKVDPAAKATEPVKALPSHTAEPAPKRFSAEAKEEWAAAPEKVRAEVARMERELTAGFEKHREAAERDAKLAPFHERSAKGGTTILEALEKYVGMEDMLRADAKNGTFKGLEVICQNTGMSLREVAAKVLGQTPDVAASQADQRVRTLENEIAELKKGFDTINSERQQAATNTTTEFVQKFATDPANSRFDELADDIAHFMTPVHDAKGNLVRAARTKDLAEAYQLAERLNPAPAVSTPAAAASSAPPAATPAPITKPTLVASSSDAGARSIAGTPTAGSDPVRKQPSSSIKEAIRRATAAAG